MFTDEKKKGIYRLLKTDLLVTIATLVITFLALMCLKEEPQIHQMEKLQTHQIEKSEDSQEDSQRMIISGIIAAIGLFFTSIVSLSKDNTDVPWSPGLAVFVGALLALLYAANLGIGSNDFTAGFIVYVIFIFLSIAVFSTILIDRKKEIGRIFLFFGTVLANFLILYEIPKLIH